ncbi:MAG: nickel pincer cofactor biosynthesis protein LarC [bacterium]|nr:nickel pincer cofactor biosynthesis protein LarC [bacterium]
MKVIYFDCFNGISGDMILGALFDLGLDREVWLRELGKLEISGYRVEIEKKRKGPLIGTDVNIIVEDKVTHRHAKEILDIVSNSRLEDEIREKSLKILTRIAQAESSIHNEPLEEVHLHELGGIDTVVDVVGSVIGLKLLGIERVYSSPLPLGEGFIETAHGRLPIPAPATIELLKGVPVYSNGIRGELVTPTGAGIISTLSYSFGPIPSVTIEKIGYGAGKKDFAIPNMLRAIMGEIYQEKQKDTNTIIDVNIDDMNPQICGYLMDKLFEMGALDVFFTPIYMKKSRPAIKLTVISPNHLVDKIVNVIFRETTSIGVRTYQVEKIMLPREIVNIDTPWGSVRVKVSYLNGTAKVMPEYDDCKAIAERTGTPIQEVMKEILTLAVKKIE